MDRTIGLSSRDLAALAQPLISYSGEMERHRLDSLHPEQILKLLGMLGDIAHASFEIPAPVKAPELVNAFLVPQFPRIEAAPGVALPILRPPRR